MFTITIKYCGGLGNQLFQIFAIISYSLDTKNKAAVVYSETSPSITKRQTYWDTIFSEFKNFSLPNTGYYILHEPFEFTYTKIPVIEDNVILSGYYQSYKYFYHNFTSIITQLKIREKQEDVREEFTESYLKKNANDQKIVSIHFRLGDYKHLKHAHPILPITYYSSALKTIKDINTKVLCFCEKEDIDTVVCMLNTLNIENVSIVSADVPDWKQMLLMSLCDYNIIANSTFSWWGAMFNANQHGIIYPSHWFHQATPTDLIPPEWKMVSIK